MRDPAILMLHSIELPIDQNAILTILKPTNEKSGGHADEIRGSIATKQDVTFPIYRIYYNNSNSKIFWVLSLTPIYSILCGDLTATMSQNSTAVYL